MAIRNTETCDGGLVGWERELEPSVEMISKEDCLYALREGLLWAGISNLEVQLSWWFCHSNARSNSGFSAMDIGKQLFGERNKIIRLVQEEKWWVGEVNSEFLRGLYIK